MEVRGQPHSPAALTPGREPSIPIRQKAKFVQSRSGRGSEEKNSMPLPETEICNLVTILTELSWLFFDMISVYFLRKDFRCTDLRFGLYFLKYDFNTFLRKVCIWNGVTMKFPE
jgi:hypothetical protein